MSEKFTLIHAQKPNHAVELMAGLFGVSRVGHDAWARRQGTLLPTAARSAALTEVIAPIHDDSHQTSGFRRVLAELGRRGTPHRSGWCARS